MAEDNVKDIPDLQKKYHWTEFLSNYIQNLEMELNNAGVENKEYFQSGSEEKLIIENTRRAICSTPIHIMSLETKKSVIGCMVCGSWKIPTGAGDI